MSSFSSIVGMVSCGLALVSRRFHSAFQSCCGRYGLVSDHHSSGITCVCWHRQHSPVTHNHLYCLVSLECHSVNASDDWFTLMALLMPGHLSISEILEIEGCVWWRRGREDVERDCQNSFIPPLATSIPPLLHERAAQNRKEIKGGRHERHFSDSVFLCFLLALCLKNMEMLNPKYNFYLGSQECPVSADF